MALVLVVSPPYFQARLWAADDCPGVAECENELNTELNRLIKQLDEARAKAQKDYDAFVATCSKAQAAAVAGATAGLGTCTYRAGVAFAASGVICAGMLFPPAVLTCMDLALANFVRSMAICVAIYAGLLIAATVAYNKCVGVAAASYKSTIEMLTKAFKDNEKAARDRFDKCVANAQKECDDDPDDDPND